MFFEWHSLHALVLVHFFPLDCVFSGHATRWCSLPLTSAMLQSGIMIVFCSSSGMDEISVVFGSIMESCAFGEKSCEFKMKKR
jgi:hypothetical protein